MGFASGGSGNAFTKLYEAWLPLLREAKVSGQEMLVLAHLLQWQGNYPMLSRPVRLIAQKTGISEANVRRCLAKLCNDRILPNGEPILSQYSYAGFGHCASYYCNLPSPEDMQCFPDEA